jgi:hypothetical protein
MSSIRSVGKRRNIVAIAISPLYAGQLGTNAVMDAPAKRQRAHVAPGYVQPIRVPINLSVAIGRT